MVPAWALGPVVIAPAPIGFDVIAGDGAHRLLFEGVAEVADKVTADDGWELAQMIGILVTARDLIFKLFDKLLRNRGKTFARYAQASSGNPNRLVVLRQSKPLSFIAIIRTQRNALLPLPFNREAHRPFFAAVWLIKRIGRFVRIVRHDHNVVPLGAMDKA